jgi:di/tricarboxylate transporter
VTTEQSLVFLILAVTLVLFVWGRWRYDVVAMFALLAVSLANLVPHESAFSGFGHPAVITVAAVLVISRGLQNAGVVDFIAKLLLRVGNRPTVQVATLTLTVGLCSAFMNNVGALALLMPVAIGMARRCGRSPAYLLMPIAFASLLGGMTTLIGTPPNIIVSTFRAGDAAEPFGMFDYSPVGLGIMLAGLMLIALFGWRLIPDRVPAQSADDLFKIEEYLTEVRVPQDSKVVNKPLHYLHSEVAKDIDMTVLGLVRDDTRRFIPSSYEVLKPEDILIVEADTEQLKSLLDAAGLELAESHEAVEGMLKSDKMTVLEAVVRNDSLLRGKSVIDYDLRRRDKANLLALARKGKRLTQRIGKIRLQLGDILLLQVPSDSTSELLDKLGLLPLAERKLRFDRPPRLVLATALFAAGIASTATGFLPAQLAFALVAVAMLVSGLLSMRDAYEAVDWPVIVLLGAMIPVGMALETTGGASLIADGILRVGQTAPQWATVGLLLVGAMFLSDIVNNAAAAVLLCPIALRLADGMQVSADPMLMSVAIGASCAFLTPIGHQSNTLVMEPGGYRFGDYWRLGLPLEMVVFAVGLPLILWIWPLNGGH